MGATWQVVDASCGDFGTRRWVTRNGVTVASWGTMEDSFTHFSMLSGRTARKLEELVGFHIPTAFPAHY